jgi:hypothetical protein
VTTKYGWIYINVTTKYGWIYIKQTQNDKLTSDPPSALLRAGANVTTVKSLIIENSSPIENGDFERFLAFRLARIGIFL